MASGLNDNRQMFYGATPEIFERARLLRENMTGEEIELWKSINSNKLGIRFKPQHPIKNYIVDFYSHKVKLVIEVDGGIHLNSQIKERDIGRQEHLESLGLLVLRFTNEEVVQNIDGVLQKIKDELEKRKSIK
jgi:cyclase